MNQPTIIPFPDFIIDTDLITTIYLCLLKKKKTNGLSGMLKSIIYIYIYIIIIAIYHLTIQTIIDDQLIRSVSSCLSSQRISNLCFWILIAFCLKFSIVAGPTLTYFNSSFLHVGRYCFWWNSSFIHGLWLQQDQCHRTLDGSHTIYCLWVSFYIFFLTF